MWNKWMFNWVERREKIMLGMGYSARGRARPGEEPVPGGTARG